MYLVSPVDVVVVREAAAEGSKCPTPDDVCQIEVEIRKTIKYSLTPKRVGQWHRSRQEPEAKH